MSRSCGAARVEYKATDRAMTESTCRREAARLQEYFWRRCGCVRVGGNFRSSALEVIFSHSLPLFEIDA